MLKTFIEALMGAEADALCGTPYEARSEDRVSFRNGYRAGSGTPGTGSWKCPSPSCVPGPASLIGCWSGAGGPSGR